MVAELSVDFDREGGGERHAHRCRVLWRTVVLQALADAMRRFEVDAIHWLFTDSEDVRLVCELASFDLRYLRPRVATALVATAKTLARNKDARYNAETNRVEWRKPSKSRRAAAQRFLSDPSFWLVAPWAVLPDDQHEVETTLFQAVMAIRQLEQEEQSSGDDCDEQIDALEYEGE